MPSTIDLMVSRTGPKWTNNIRNCASRDTLISTVAATGIEKMKNHISDLQTVRWTTLVESANVPLSDHEFDIHKKAIKYSTASYSESGRNYFSSGSSVK